jgi:hypothetical protein
MILRERSFIMLKTLSTVVNIAGTILVIYTVGNAVYERGKEAGRKEAEEAINAAPDVVDDDQASGDEYVIHDGVVYKRCVK